MRTKADRTHYISKGIYLVVFFHQYYDDIYDDDYII